MPSWYNAVRTIAVGLVKSVVVMLLFAGVVAVGYRIVTNFGDGQYFAAFGWVLFEIGLILASVGILQSPSRPEDVENGPGVVTCPLGHSKKVKLDESEYYCVRCRRVFNAGWRDNDDRAR